MPAQKRLITAEDLYNFELASGTRLSPDGKHVAYAQHRVDRKTEKKYSNLWIVATNGTEPRQFTFGDQNDSTPRWSPDGKSIAFLSNRADKEKLAQIYLIPFFGGEAHKLTDIKGQIGSLAWSPNGKKLLLTVRKSDPEELERQDDEQKKKLGVVARHYTRLFYKLDGFGYLPHERWHIWVVDAVTGKAKQLTDHAVWDEQSPTWSPDGKFIVFVSNHQTDPDQATDFDDIFVLPTEGGEPRKIETPVGPKNHPSFSPDGKWLAYDGYQGEHLDFKNTSLWVVPVDSSLPARNLTEKYDIHISAWTINDTMELEYMPPTWSRDGKTLYFQTTVHGATRLNSIAVDGSKLQTIINENGVVSSFCLDREQKSLAYFFGSMTDPGQVVFQAFPGGKPMVLTSLNRWLEKVDLGKVEEVWFNGQDGNRLQGWILTPPGFNPARKYPSIMEIHGGPMVQYGFYFMHEFYYFASKGYVIYFSNPRGGRGYGEEHTRAIWQSWGDKDYADLMAWADYAEKLAYIDREKMSVTGGSYGGYMTLWIIGHTQRFRAAVTQRCVSNFVSMWGSSDFNYTFQFELNGKPPFEDLQTFWKHSPIAYIGNAKTPTKVIHNENDHRCPIEQGEQVFVALKRLGIDTEFIRFPEEFHGLSRTGRTDRRIARLNHIIGWFEKYLK